MSLNGRRRIGRDRVRIGVIGAGTFARSVLIPALGRGAELTAVATRTGVSARSTAQRFGAAFATTDPAEVLASEQVDGVIIATRHNLHAELAVAALEAGKHVFVEKPLALSDEDLTRVQAVSAASPGVFMVGFNRRFARLASQLRSAIAVSGPMLVTYRVNAGRLPRSHWSHDPEQGGGRIVGEACHFVDFAAYLCAGRPHVIAAEGVSGSSEPLEDNIAATLRFDDGSLATIVYSALGDPGLEKERVEVLSEVGAGILSDFTSLTLHRAAGTEIAQGKRDKGHAREIAVFLDACRSGRQPWPVEDMVAVTRATFAMRDSVLARRT
jgi:predicted dehydrogenase